MTRLYLPLLVILLSLPAAALAQTATSSIAVIDMRRAITENGEGNKAAELWVSEINKKQTEFEREQKAVEEMENRLRTQERVLSDAEKINLTRQIDQARIKLNRMNEDAQKYLGELQQELLQPIATVTNRILNAYAAEKGFDLIFDVSGEFSLLVYVADAVDITDEVIQRVDAEMASR